MSQKKLQKGCLIALALYLVLAVVFYLVAGDQIHYRDRQTDMLSGSAVVGELTAGTVVTQSIWPQGDRLTGLTFYAATYDRQNTGTLHIELHGDGGLLAVQDVDVSALADNSAFFLPFDVELPGGPVRVQVTAPDGAPGNAVTLYYGNTRSAARAQVVADLSPDELVQVNGVPLDGGLCLRVSSRDLLWFGAYYWYFVAAGFVLLGGDCLLLLHKNKQGKSTLVLKVISAFSRYRYLMKQLVARDFKTKYKRSVLGVLWSFLNPLLTMLVQYIVFSTLFRSDIPNFSVYLLTGIVCFNFFSEATSMALTSIVGNAALITKVYVPKYIYPLTRVISSTINFLLALVPLLAVLLVTRTPIRPAILLMPLGIVCLFAVSLGIGMLLASAMVFFRDTQFLWGVLSMLWMYATPIFYPESIIPAGVMPLYKCNPLYHVIRFIRILLIDGISPEPKAYALMLLTALAPLVLGVLVFKRTQDRFVLHI